MAWYDKQIDNKIANCETCQKYQKSNTREELMPSKIPTLSWQVLGTDLFYINKKAFIITVEIQSISNLICLNDESSETTKNLLKSYFARFGIPKVVRFDNGPQFSSKKFKEFAKDWNLKYVTSSPRYPQCNGFVGRQVQTVKKILKKAMYDGKDPFLALLKFKITRISNKTLIRKMFAEYFLIL